MIGVACHPQTWHSSVYTRLWELRVTKLPPRAEKRAGKNCWIISNSAMLCPTVLKFGTMVHHGPRTGIFVIKAKNDWRNGWLQVTSACYHFSSYYCFFSQVGVLPDSIALEHHSTLYGKRYNLLHVQFSIGFRSPYHKIPGYRGFQWNIRHVCGTAEKVFKFRGQRSRSMTRPNAIKAEAYIFISTMWRQVSLVSVNVRKINFIRWNR